MMRLQLGTLVCVTGRDTSCIVDRLWTVNSASTLSPVAAGLSIFGHILWMLTLCNANPHSRSQETHTQSLRTDCLSSMSTALSRAQGCLSFFTHLHGWLRHTSGATEENAHAILRQLFSADISIVDDLFHNFGVVMHA